MQQYRQDIPACSHPTIVQESYTHYPSLWKGLQFATASIAGTHATLFGDPDLENFNLEMHHLALAIAKKSLHENRLRNAQKTTYQPASNFQIRDRVYFKSSIMENGSKMEILIDMMITVTQDRPQ